MRNVPESMIPFVEKALDMKLYENQRDYLVGKHGLVGGRRTGKTIAYCIKLSLSDGAPINIQTPELYSDRQGVPHNAIYSRQFFRNEFMDVRDKLRTFGFPVRLVKNVRGEFI